MLNFVGVIVYTKESKAPETIKFAGFADSPEQLIKKSVLGYAGSRELEATAAFVKNVPEHIWQFFQKVMIQ